MSLEPDQVYHSYNDVNIELGSMFLEEQYFTILLISFHFFESYRLSTWRGSCYQKHDFFYDE